MNIATCIDTSHFVLESATRKAPDRNNSPKEGGMESAAPDGDVVHELQRDIITMDCKKPRRAQLAFMTHRGNKFKRAGSLTITAPEPDEDIKSPGRGAQHAPPRSASMDPWSFPLLGSLPLPLASPSSLGRHRSARLQWRPSPSCHTACRGSSAW